MSGVVAFPTDTGVTTISNPATLSYYTGAGFTSPPWNLSEGVMPTLISANTTYTPYNFVWTADYGVTEITDASSKVATLYSGLGFTTPPWNITDGSLPILDSVSSSYQSYLNQWENGEKNRFGIVTLEQAKKKITYLSSANSWMKYPYMFLYYKEGADAYRIAVSSEPLAFNVYGDTLISVNGNNFNLENYQLTVVNGTPSPTGIINDVPWLIREDVPSVTAYDDWTLLHSNYNIYDYQTDSYVLMADTWDFTQHSPSGESMFNMDTVWNIQEGKDFPYLRWMEDAGLISYFSYFNIETPFGNAEIACSEDNISNLKIQLSPEITASIVLVPTTHEKASPVHIKMPDGIYAMQTRTAEVIGATPGTVTPAPLTWKSYFCPVFKYSDTTATEFVQRDITDFVEYGASLGYYNFLVMTLGTDFSVLASKSAFDVDLNTYIITSTSSMLEINASSKVAPYDNVGKTLNLSTFKGTATLSILQGLVLTPIDGTTYSGDIYEGWYYTFALLEKYSTYDVSDTNQEQIYDYVIKALRDGYTYFCLLLDSTAHQLQLVASMASMTHDGQKTLTSTSRMMAFKKDYRVYPGTQYGTSIVTLNNSIKRESVTLQIPDYPEIVDAPAWSTFARLTNYPSPYIIGNYTQEVVDNFITTQIDLGRYYFVVTYTTSTNNVNIISSTTPLSILNGEVTTGSGTFYRLNRTTLAVDTVPAPTTGWNPTTIIEIYTHQI